MSLASSHKFAHELASRFSEVVPGAIDVTADGDAVRLATAGRYIGASSAASLIEEEDRRPEMDRLVDAAIAVLSELQDDLMVHFRAEWPRDGQGRVGYPDASILAGQLFLWYGPSYEAAVVRLRPIMVAVLEGRPPPASPL